MGTPRRWTEERLERLKRLLDIHGRYDLALETLRAVTGERLSQGGGSDAFRGRYGLTPGEYVRQCATAADAVPTVQEQIEEWRKGAPTEEIRIIPKSDGLSAILLLSDWHVGPDNGVINRASQLASRVASALQDRELDEIVVCMIGDIVDGEGIFSGQEIALRAGAGEQLKIAVHPLYLMVRQLAKIAPVRIFGVAGNHGRSKKQSPWANWDYALYQILDGMLREEGISVTSDISQLSLVVRGRKGIIRHWAPVQCETAAQARRFGDWLHNAKAEWIAHGHWHHWSASSRNRKLILRNGCLCGDNDFAEELGYTAAPSQLLVMATDGPCTSWPVIPIEFDG